MWSGWPSQFGDVLKFESRPRESNSVSFMSVVPKQQTRTQIFIVQIR
jgi:hypothetical protein